MLRFMRNKILIPLLILGALATFFSFRYGGDDSNTDSRKELVLKSVMKAINEAHFSPLNVDDSLSNRVYNKILTNLDYEKKFFTQQDIDMLKKYQYSIDDEIKDGSLEFFEKLNEIFSKRIDNAESYYKELLAKPFDFSKKEEVNLDGEDIPYSANESALKEHWRKYLKYRVLAKYVDLKDDQAKKKENKDSANAKMKTDAEMELEARNAVRKNQDFYFKRLRKLKDEDRFSLYINSIANSEDPHTDYLPPADKKRFDEAMSGTFFGIGAQLKDEEGKIKIASIIAGSPCWKQGELKAGDEIVKVAQGPAEPVDVQGYEIEDAVKLIRGEKGTEVRLTVKKVNGATQVIPIIRGEVLLEEVFAKSAIIKTDDGPVGYIYLPEFYSDFQHIDGRRCAEDVAIEVMKLKNEGVKGIILDLRYNGGGSLSDVVDMTGQFIDQGPVVQVKSSVSAATTLSDPQKGTLYDGPMVVMVNQSSASASEIMAAALQDYKRAVIVGAPTFGKGTVQKLLSLDDMNRFSGSTLANNIKGKSTEPIGSIKLTVQKFYRVNGGSTQLKGVTPDIILPDPYKYIDMGERRDKAALPWDEIPAAAYTPAKNPVQVAPLLEQSNKRIANNPTFKLIEENALRIKKQQDDNVYSLNEKDYRKEVEEANATSEKMEELQKKATTLNIANPKEDIARINRDSTTIAKNDVWLKNLKKDLYLSETVNIINDLSKQSMKLNMGTGMK
jgi:carboxyl-terminal processing protease